MAFIPTGWKDSEEIQFLCCVAFFSMLFSPKKYGVTTVCVSHIYFLWHCKYPRDDLVLTQSMLCASAVPVYIKDWSTCRS